MRAGGKASSTCGGMGTWGAAAPFLVRPPDAPLLCVPHAGPALRHKPPPDSTWGGEQGMKVLVLHLVECGLDLGQSPFSLYSVKWGLSPTDPRPFLALTSGHSVECFSLE